MRVSKKGWAWIKVSVFLLCLSPFLLLVYDTVYNQLGSNPIETLHFRLGDWALRFLCIGLALTPLKKVLKQSWPIRFRRMVGLYAFFYASLHLLVYIALDLSFSWENFIDEVPQSPYILVGLFCYLLLLALALTSTKAMQKRLAKRWVKLHKLVYIACLAAVIHYLWLVKSDLSTPLWYTSLVLLLLLFRIPTKRRKHKKENTR